MSAIHGTGREYDVTMKSSTYTQTTTAQYKVVGMGSSTTSADWTCYLADAGTALSDTATAHGAIGIIQDRPSASSDYNNVRLFGLSKAYCASSIAAGDFVNAYDGASTTTFPGYIEGLDITATITSMVLLGRALEDGSTGTVITIMLNPSFRHQI